MLGHHDLAWENGNGRHPFNRQFSMIAEGVRWLQAWLFCKPASENASSGDFKG